MKDKFLILSVILAISAVIRNDYSDILLSLWLKSFVGAERNE